MQVLLRFHVPHVLHIYGNQKPHVRKTLASQARFKFVCPAACCYTQTDAHALQVFLVRFCGIGVASRGSVVFATSLL
jgi:hypothetical protein